jgi:hypothetical protein
MVLKHQTCHITHTEHSHLETVHKSSVSKPTLHRGQQNICILYRRSLNLYSYVLITCIKFLKTVVLLKYFFVHFTKIKHEFT